MPPEEIWSWHVMFPVLLISCSSRPVQIWQCISTSTRDGRKWGLADRAGILMNERQRGGQAAGPEPVGEQGSEKCATIKKDI